MLGGRLADRALEHRLVGDRREHREPADFVAAGDEEDELLLAGNVDMAERAGRAERLAGGLPGIGPRLRAGGRGARPGRAT